MSQDPSVPVRSSTGKDATSLVDAEPQAGREAPPGKHLPAKKRAAVGKRPPADKKAPVGEPAAAGVWAPPEPSAEAGAPDPPRELLLPRIVCVGVGSDTDTPAAEVVQYAAYLAEVLGAECHSAPASIEASPPTCPHESHPGRVEDWDPVLVVLEEKTRSVNVRLFGHASTDCAAARYPCSVLVARHPSRPIRRLLLVLQGDEADTPATAWSVRVAAATRAEVAVIPVSAPIPVPWSRECRTLQLLPCLLDPGCSTAQRLREIAGLMKGCGISAALHLRQGTVDQQLRDELTDTRYDLAIVGARYQDSRWSWLLAGVAQSLLRWAEMPVLMARPEDVVWGAGADRLADQTLSG